MRDREQIDSELRLVALRRRAIREQGGQLSSREADELLDEILAHGAGSSKVDAFDAWETGVDAATGSRAGKIRAIVSRRRKVAALRRLGLFAALPLSLVAVVSAVVVMFALHRQDSSAQPEDTPPSSAPSKPVAPKASGPAIGVVDAAFIAALKQEGVPVPSQEYVMSQGHAVCDFLAHQRNFGDAAAFVQRTSIWDAKQSTAVTAGAIVSYCPQSRPAGPDPMQPDYQKSLSDLQDIERNLQGIQGKLQDIQGGLDTVPGRP
ncbi:DUF732 domain-containing protein [Mycobacterium sp. 852002-40037_SCH5390672]|uniref:DUF732 domain-containing protein n=1 Tax=Mycobacterium sp. 852002-40037_SCH5390672 TaxID=1834089 RepID=UPI00080513F7|nr:DUF732 domain-containing protein [Mycobacterium sp. 852002-40037_SCH5390672]OBB92953.1 hypothetical protein A5782_12075 [Mycobacterium sp. 852002-40037_SCH5390672]